jgi:predicted ATPase
MKGIGKMREVPKWYVLTGSPLSGITSTIKYLEKLGYYVIEEAARRIGELSKKWYVSLGYEVVLIPRASVEETANMILSHIA